MTAPGEVGDPRIQVPIRIEPNGKTMPASVPMATGSSIGDPVAIIPTDEFAMQYAAAPLRVPEVGETVVISRIRNEYGGIKFVGIPVIHDRVIPGNDPWGTTSINYYWALKIEAIGPTSAIILMRSGHIFRSDDSGATWTNTGGIPGADMVGAIVATDGAGGYLAWGRTLPDYRPAVWQFDGVTMEYTKVWDGPTDIGVGIDNFRMCKAGNGYYLYTPKKCFNSPDGITWSVVADPPFAGGAYYNNISSIFSLRCIGNSIYTSARGYTSGCYGGLWVSNDLGASWTHLQTPPSAWAELVGGFFGVWTDGSLFSGGYTAGGPIPHWYLSRGSGFSEIVPNAGIPELYHVEAVPGSNGMAFAAIKWAPSNTVAVYRSTDYGVTWTPVINLAGTSEDPILDGAILPNGVVILVYDGLLNSHYAVYIYHSKIP